MASCHGFVIHQLLDQNWADDNPGMVTQHQPTRLRMFHKILGNTEREQGAPSNPPAILLRN